MVILDRLGPGDVPATTEWSDGSGGEHAAIHAPFTSCESARVYQRDLDTKIEVAKERFRLFLRGTNLKGVLRDGASGTQKLDTSAAPGTVGRDGISFVQRRVITDAPSCTRGTSILLDAAVRGCARQRGARSSRYNRLGPSSGRSAVW